MIVLEIKNKKRNGGRYRMLYETSRGRRRLLHAGDTVHPDRNGDIVPDKSDLPDQYRTLVDWYEAVYSKTAGTLNRARGEEEKEPTRGMSREEITWSDEQTSAGTAYVSAAGAFVIPEYLRRRLGICEGTRLGVYREEGRLILQPITKEFIRSLVGCAKGDSSLVEAREREHRMEK